MSAGSPVVVVHVYDGCDLYIGRGDGGDAHLNNTEVGQRGWLGNPYTVGEFTRSECIRLYRRDFYRRIRDDAEFRERVRGIRGRLGCWCRHAHEDEPACHGDVVADYVRRWVNR